MKLTQENIQFIDKYLLRSEVKYADIRAEMLDHIASAVEKDMNEEEQTFYEAFRKYMATNKRALLKMNRMSNSASLVLVKHYFSFITKPIMIILAMVIFFLMTIVFRNQTKAFSEEHHFYFFQLVLLLTVFAPQFIVYIITKKRFYYIERSGFIVFLLYNIMLFLNFMENGELKIYSIACCSCFTLGYIFYMINNLKEFYTRKIYFTAIVK